MSEGIRVAGVLGAGVMGSAIAAHLAGAGLKVHLLDIVDSDAKQRSGAAQRGLSRALKSKPALFFDEDAARLVVPGNLEDHLARLGECDLVIEAVPENIEIKKSLFSKIAPHLADAAVLASNTSGLSIAEMSASLPAELRSRFLVLHFFNPVRYMRLLEIVAAPQTDPELLTRMARFGEFLGKGVVYGKDTTNFVANRIGVYGLMLAMHEMVERRMSIEQVDATLGRALGRPKSAAFKTCDIVGIDTMIHVAGNCYDSLASDSQRDVFQVPGFVAKLAATGNLGRKTGAGFYRKRGKQIEVLDVAKGEYRVPEPVEFESLAAAKKQGVAWERVRAVIAGEDQAAGLAWTVLAKTLTYSAKLVGEIADDIVNIDRAMRWGFNWDLGPFETWDAIGVRESVQRMEAEGFEVPRWVQDMLASGRETFYAGLDGGAGYYDRSSKRGRPLEIDPRHLSIAERKVDSKHVVRTNAGASLVDLGDGVLGVELHTKLNTLDLDVIEMLNVAVEIGEGTFDALLIANDTEHFSAGANLMMIASAAQAKQWDKIDEIIKGLQGALQRLRYSSLPVVGAPCQYTLGGGAELAMACDANQAHAETYMGLVEVGVGLIPAGCGCLRMVERYTAPLMHLEGADLLVPIAQASLNIAMAKTSTSADEARRLRYLRPEDGISLNRDFLLHEAKQRALGMSGAGYRPPRPPMLPAAGLDAAKTIGAKVWGMVEGGWASPHDALIANKLAHILCGGAVAEGTLLPEQHFLDLEREAFLQLCGEPDTQARIEHMLKTGKPLRN